MTHPKATHHNVTTGILAGFALLAGAGTAVAQSATTPAGAAYGCANGTASARTACATPMTRQPTSGRTGTTKNGVPITKGIGGGGPGNGGTAGSSFGGGTNGGANPPDSPPSAGTGN